MVALLTLECPFIKLMIFEFLIRYKYENDRVMDISSPDVKSPLTYQLYGNGKIGTDVPSRGSQNQLLERQVFFLLNGSFCVCNGYSSFGEKQYVPYFSSILRW